MIGNSIAIRPLKFGYANARVKAMKQSLLQKRELDAIAETSSLPEIYALLERTPYRQDIVDASLKESPLPDQIELACTRNFSRALKKVLKVIPEDARPVIMGLFERYEIENIKLIISGKQSGLDKERISAMVVETGFLPRGVLARMIAAHSVKEAISALEGTPYHAAISAATKKEFTLEKALAAIDSHYYGKISAIAEKFLGEETLILGMMKAQVDAKNISVVLRAKKENLPEKQIIGMILATGNITKEKIKSAISAKTVEEAAKILDAGFGLSNAIEQYRKGGSLISIEIAVEKGMARKGLHVLRRGVLSVSAIAGFLLVKEEEVNNIRKIVRAKEFGIAPEKLKEMLVAV